MNRDRTRRADGEVWTNTSLGWFRERLGPPGTGGYPPPGLELRLIERYVPLAGRDVLEVGCGDGRLTFQYAARARSVVALDANADEIERAREMARRGGFRNVRFLARAVQAGRLPGGPFDVALLTWSL
ncbi:MAG TPA: class I SAM-dependent methyltransferase [Candidatus Limnocylindria bacterium]|jgi:2-polyprenyl-3-methyl-5-hydroxy-6-metoxy-1,4-benzoquinol methylase|nr:class I SAM-dependent methyltransferase [Candidatus Limnocylindria bacterium]